MEPEDEKSARAKVPTSNEDFDAFLSKFRSFSNDASLDYWADLVFVTFLATDPVVEKRFKGGLWLWVSWVSRRLISMRRNRQDLKNPEFSKRFAFYLLPTTAHQGSLAEIIREVPAAESCYYSEAPSRSPDSSFINCDLASNGSAIPLRARIAALRRTLMIIKGLLDILGKEKILLQHSRFDFIPRLAELIFRSQLLLARLNHNDCAHQEVFVTYELTPECKALVLWATQNGKRAIHVMHGQRLPTYQITEASDLLLFSTIDQPWFRQRVRPDIDIHCVGHPRLEAIRAEVASTARPDRGPLPRIAFFSQPFESDYTRKIRLQDWLIFAALKGHAEVRLRLHPRESRSAAIEDLESIGAGFVKISDAGLAEDLKWCDAIASSWSTVSMEAAVCGRAVFWSCATPERYQASQALRDQGIGTLVSAPEQWEPWLRQWQTGAWQPPAMIEDKKLIELGMVGNPDRGWLERLNII